MGEELLNDLVLSVFLAKLWLMMTMCYEFGIWRVIHNERLIFSFSSEFLFEPCIA
jgi:hypothetical protein